MFLLFEEDRTLGPLKHQSGCHSARATFFLQESPPRYSNGLGDNLLRQVEMLLEVFIKVTDVFFP
jgi:hypothetical protein